MQWGEDGGAQQDEGLTHQHSSSEKPTGPLSRPRTWGFREGPPMPQSSK